MERTTVTLDKEKYDELMRIEEAFFKNEVILTVSLYVFGTKKVKISTYKENEALKQLAEENQKLESEIERLQSRKWWQVLFNLRK